VANLSSPEEDEGLKSVSETTKRCQVEMYDGEPCGRDLYDENHCIFHSEKEDKDVKLFQTGFNAILAMVAGEVEFYDLTRFIFPYGVVFPKKLSKPVTLWGSVFKGEADFESTAFEDKVYFLYTVFKGKANFESAIFKGQADFENSTFEGKAHFRRAAFEGDTSFDGVAFRSVVYFADAVFKGGVGFGMTLFKHEADFWGTLFKSGVLFWGTRFEDNIDFTYANFEDTLLINAEAHEKKGITREADFRWANFSKPEKIEFQKVDLSCVRFLETDVRKVHFTDVDWNKEKDKGRNRVFDEVSPDPETKKFDYALIAQLYRRLRANYEENLQYPEAGDFYIGEMEMTRKAQTSIFKKLPLLFYKAISNYGESYYRPLFWIAAIFLLFPLLFMFSGIQPMIFDPGMTSSQYISYKFDFSSLESVAPTWDELGDYYTCFLYSMSVFSFIRDKKYTTIDNWGHTFFVLESILSPVTLAFFLLALRRRFKR
jgi:hypothetical protein